MPVHDKNIKQYKIVRAKIAFITLKPFLLEFTTGTILVYLYRNIQINMYILYKLF